MLWFYDLFCFYLFYIYNSRSHSPDAVWYECWGEMKHVIMYDNILNLLNLSISIHLRWDLIYDLWFECYFLLVMVKIFVDSKFWGEACDINIKVHVGDN